MIYNKTNKIHELKIAGKIFQSSLMLGTGKYKNIKEAIESITISKTSIVTVAIRRATNINTGKASLIDLLDWKKLWLLPNTAGCQSAEEAIRIALLGKELNKQIGQLDNKFIKLEVIPDPQHLLPDPIGTLKAAEYLVKKDFNVLAYTNSDPILAKQLEEIGCSAVMPLASPIGSGQGLQSLFNLAIIIQNSKVPVIIDAGIGTASEASKAMELGADGVLLNTAIAQAAYPQMMANAMRLAVQSGKYAKLAGRMKQQIKANPSSPSIGIST
uniref:Thiazole synthase n=1 Tax=Corallina officinalis TaxID=35170 RepID=A0A6M3WC32_COROI|nr:thiamin biosynthesis protein G [Corallina officinalis]QJF58482.1 thiamin biosynthesis protein G [Corallina officinalis]QJF58681.1 thiamin biosynthesis protein G [Corallina officinalis]QJF58880.1 thiamin biosynthesis protein G [Corallina officinalis]